MWTFDWCIWNEKITARIGYETCDFWGIFIYHILDFNYSSCITIGWWCCCFKFCGSIKFVSFLRWWGRNLFLVGRTAPLLCGSPNTTRTAPSYCMFCATIPPSWHPSFCSTVGATKPPGWTLSISWDGFCTSFSPVILWIFRGEKWEVGVSIIVKRCVRGCGVKRCVGGCGMRVWWWFSDLGWSPELWYDTFWGSLAVL